MQQQNNGASLVAVQGCYTTKEFPHLRHSPCDYHISWYTGEKAYIVESIIVYTEEGSRATYDQWVCLPSPRWSMIVARSHDVWRRTFVAVIVPHELIY